MLVLVFNRLEEDPLEALKTLPKLKILKLHYFSYEGKKMMCSGGADAFPQLQVLDIDGLYNLQELSIEEGGIPALMEFRVRGCYRLTDMPNQLSDIMIRY